jgi:two-component system, NarL family, nitrate/nitrite response regulator NarL
MRRPFQLLVVRPSTAQREFVPVAVATDCRTVALSTHAGDLAQSRRVEDQPVLLIVDAGDDPEGAIAQIKLFKEGCPSARVAILADEYHRSDLVSAYQAGANGCFVKVMSCGGFMRACEMIMLGETVLPPELLPFIAEPQDHHEHTPALANRTMPPDRSANGAIAADRSANGAMAPEISGPIGLDGVPRLSAREKCILRCVVDGDSNKAIARKIEIAEATVKVHVKAILRKIRLHNRTQAAIWAMNHSSLIWSTE